MDFIKSMLTIGLLGPYSTPLELNSPIIGY